MISVHLKLLLGIGAVDGTTCGSGKLCFEGNCVSSLQATTGDCLYGDDYVTINDIGTIIKNITSSLLTCNAIIQILVSNGYDPVWFCQNKQVTFGSACCQTCSSNFIFFEFNKFYTLVVI